MEERNEMGLTVYEGDEVEVIEEQPEPSTGEKIVKGVGAVAIIGGAIFFGKKIVGFVGEKLGGKSKDEKNADKLRKKGYVVLTPEQLKEAGVEDVSSSEKTDEE